MRIHLATPAPPGSRLGNGVTASRWQDLFAALGHRVRVAGDWSGEPCDLLVAIHARRSHGAVAALRRAHARVRVVVVLSGTDLYCDLPAGNPQARASLALADRLVVLEPRALEVLDEDLRGKARVIVQSAVAPARRPPATRRFEVCMLSHLRPIKDPLRAARAARLLPARSRLRVLHAGAALDPQCQRAAEREMRENPRYRWLGPLAEKDALDLLVSSRLLVLPSKVEGCANAACEALAAGVPLVASRIPGNVGLLGEGYAGYHEVGDTMGLAALLDRVETDPGLYRQLEDQVAARRMSVDPARERLAWSALFAELA